MGEAFFRPDSIGRTYWPLANPTWEEALRGRRSLLPPGLPLDQRAVAQAVRVFDALRLPDVEGQPLIGDSGNEWARDILRALFGSWDATARIRYVEEIFALTPKKQGKTTNAAGIMLVALLLNQRPNAQFALFGPTQEVADLAFNAIRRMIEADEELPLLMQVQSHLKIITNRTTGATLKVMTFDAKVATGGKYAGALIDEVHLLGSMSYASDVLRQIRGGRVSIAEGFLIFISTQSDGPPAGVFKTELDYARGVRDGRIARSVLLPLLYEFPEAMQRDAAKPWLDPANWFMVTPNLGYSVSIPALITGLEKAQADGEEHVRSWASQHLNIQIGMALHDGRWAGADHWAGAAEQGLTFEALLKRCEVITFGVDGGGLDDLFGFYALGRERETGRWLGWAHAWADRVVLERRKEIAPRLLDFEREGDFTFIDIAEAGGAGPDVSEIVSYIVAARDAGLLPEKNCIGLDRAGVAAALLIDALLGEGFDQEAMRTVGQGYRLNGTQGNCARKLKQRQLVPAAQGLMAWVVGNAKAELQGHATVITKQTSGSAKIDPLIALFNAANLMEFNPQAAGVSIYESRGLLMV